MTWYWAVIIILIVFWIGDGIYLRCRIRKLEKTMKDHLDRLGDIIN